MKPIHTMGLVVAALLGVLLLLPSPETPPRNTAGDSAPVSAIVNARLFDGDEVIEDATILIEQGRIRAAGPGVEVPAGVVPLDAAGKTVLPGLIDAHVHAYGAARTEALRFGVTTLLDMFRAPFDFDVVREERDSPAATDRADLYSAGFLATAPGGHGTQYGLAVPTLTAPDQAADWVAARKSEGSNWIKIVIEPGWGSQRLPTLDAATVAALVEAAHAEGLMAVAHVSRLADARMAVAAGVDGLVHLFGDEAIDPSLLDAMRAGQVFVVPTLAVMASIYGGSPPDALAEHPVLAPRLGALQKQSLAQRFPGAGGDGQAWQRMLGNVEKLRAAGIPLLAGSDAPNPGTAQGISLHHELRLLFEAGLDPLDALRAATGAAAEVFGLDGRGCLRPGCRADLLIVDGDPIRNIEALARLDAVWKNGVPVATDAPPAPTDSSTSAPLAGAGPLDLLGQPERWVASADSYMGGNSASTLASADVSGVSVQATLAAGAPFPYAGAMWFASETPMQPVDHSQHRGLVVDVEMLGDVEAGLQLMLFSGESQQAIPARVELAANGVVEVALNAVPGLDPSLLRAVGVFVSGTPGEHAFRIRELRLE